MKKILIAALVIIPSAYAFSSTSFPHKVEVPTNFNPSKENVNEKKEGCTKTEYVTGGWAVKCKNGTLYRGTVTLGCSGYGETCEQATTNAWNCANAAVQSAIAAQAAQASHECSTIDDSVEP